MKVRKGHYMDGYTRSAISEALAKRSLRQVKFDEAIDKIINGHVIYVASVMFYICLGLQLYELIIS